MDKRIMKQKECVHFKGHTIKKMSMLDVLEITKDIRYTEHKFPFRKTHKTKKVTMEHIYIRAKIYVQINSKPQLNLDNISPEESAKLIEKLMGIKKVKKNEVSKVRKRKSKVQTTKTKQNRRNKKGKVHEN